MALSVESVDERTLYCRRARHRFLGQSTAASHAMESRRLSVERHRSGSLRDRLMAALIRIVRGERAARKDRSPQSALPSLRKWFVILGCTLLLNSTHALAGTARSVAQRTASAEMRANWLRPDGGAPPLRSRLLRRPNERAERFCQA